MKMTIRPISNELQRKAENELNEQPERVQSDINHIKEWLSKQPHLKCRTDDQWILTFLRCCKFSLQKTKEKIDAYYTIRNLMPEFFENRDPFEPEIQEYLKAGVCMPLKSTEDNGDPKKLFVVYGRADPDKVSLTTVLKVMLMIADVLLNEEDRCLAGVEFVTDFVDLPLKFVKQANPTLMKKVMICLEKAYPIRLKAFHNINTPSYFEIVFNIIKMFASKKLLQRVFFYKNDNNVVLEKYLGVSMIPQEYGGEGPSLDKTAADWRSKMESYRDWFINDSVYGTDESKRPGKPITEADVFGLEGSFRKLNID